MSRGLTLSDMANLTLVLALSLSSACLPAGAQDPSTVFGPGPAAKKAPAAPAAKAAGNAPARAAAKAPARAQSAVTHRASAPRPQARPRNGGGGGMVTASPGAITSYCNRLWSKVNNNWEFANGKNHVILTVDVDSGGNVFSTSASSQPKNPDAESKAQQALSKSQPLDALPTGLPSARLTITFDSTADPHGEASSSGYVSLRYDPNISAPSGGGASAPEPATNPAPANSGNPASGASTAPQ